MNECIILVIIGAIALLPAVFAVLYFRHRRVIEQKDRSIIQQIRKQDCLAKELERTKVENETLERLLKGMLGNIQQPSATKQDVK